MRNWFLQLELRGKITAALLGGVLVLGLAMSVPLYLLARVELTEQTQALLDARALVERREIELRLGGVVQLADSLATNTVTANALADSQGRETYLTPLLRNQKLGIDGADLTVVDYRGRAVSSSSETPLDFGTDTAFRQVMERGVASTYLQGSAGKRVVLVAGLPIRYRLTKNVEGALMLRIPLDDLLGNNSWADTRWLLDKDGTVLVGKPPEAGAFEVGARLMLLAPLDKLSLQLVLARDRAAVFRILDMLLLVFLVLGGLIIAAVSVFAKMGARFITSPLGEIAAAAEQIAASGKPTARLPVGRSDEFGRLSAAFNTMVDRLRESWGELENLVAERTRDYEESQREAVRASNLLREAVQSVAVGFVIYDQNDELVLCNDSYLRFHPFSREKAVAGARFEDIVRYGAARGQYFGSADSDGAWIAARLARHRLADGSALELCLADGRWLLVIEHRTPSGYTVGNYIEITELKKATEGLRLRENYLRATLDNLPFFFWLKDADSRFLAVNKVFAAACGKDSPEEVVGLTDNELWPREFAQVNRLDDLEVMQTRTPKSVEEVMTNSITSGWTETYKTPVISDEGVVIGTVGFARDISDRRLAEASARDRSAQLNAIFSLSPDGFVSFDSERRVKYASPAFFRMTGMAERDIVGLDENQFSLMLGARCLPATRFPGIAALRAELLPSGGTENGGEAVSVRHVIELAGPAPMVIEVGLRVSDAETVSQILYCRDVTHETEVDRMKSEFLSTAAHELRTPMASIFGFSELMLHEEFSASERQEFLGAIHRQSTLMVSIINELLDLARIEARRGKDFNFLRIDVHEVIDSLASSLKVPAGREPPLLPERQHPQWVRADAKKLLQAIANVLSNAYKYSPDGGDVVLEVIESADKLGDPCVGIRVTDQGIGMTPAQLDRVCERFYRADTSGKIPGTGLGMSIVKEIIDLHGGAVDMSSQPGQGSIVTLWIPAAAEAATLD